MGTKQLEKDRKEYDISKQQLGRKDEPEREKPRRDNPQKEKSKNT